MAACSLPFAHGGPPLRGVLRAQPEDFVVDEIDAFCADGVGEHLLLRVEKRGENTDWVAGELARFLGVPRLAVGYAGMKDRHALTRQRYSVHWPGSGLADFSAWPHGSVRVLEQTRHRRKLRRGALAGNRFRLCLREIAGDLAAAEAVLARIAERGVPNYFGEQRFGHDALNVARARALLAGRRRARDRQQRAILLSSARAALFNAVLAARVRDGSWQSLLPGERVLLDGSQAHFLAEQIDASLIQRLSAFDVHPSGPLPGRGGAGPVGEAAAREGSVLAAEAELVAALAAAGLDAARRPLRLRPQGLSWSYEAAARILHLDFALPPGGYATVLLRELVDATRPA